MDGLLKSLPTILRAAGDSAEVAEAACFAAWKHAAGEALRELAVPLRFGQKTLVVAVIDETWQKQLQSLSGQLLARVNSILGQSLVTFLEFRVEPKVVTDACSRLKQPAGQRGELDVMQLDQVVPMELVAAAAGIEDKDLRRAFLGAAISCLKRIETKI